MTREIQVITSSKYHTARTIILRSQTHVPTSARNAFSWKSISSVAQRMSSPHRHHNHYRPAHGARPSIACVRAQAAAAAAAGLARCDATDALPCAAAPKGLPAALCVCVCARVCVCCTSRPSPATKYRSLSSSPSVSPPSLLFSPLHPLPYTRKPLPLSYTNFHTYHNVYPQHPQEKERGGGARRASRGQRR